MSDLIILDTALADVDALVAESAEYLSRRLGGTPPLDPSALPRDAAGALSAIDAWAGADVANWRQDHYEGPEHLTETTPKLLM